MGLFLPDKAFVGHRSLLLNPYSCADVGEGVGGEERLFEKCYRTAHEDNFIVHYHVICVNYEKKQKPNNRI